MGFREYDGRERACGGVVTDRLLLGFFDFLVKGGMARLLSEGVRVDGCVWF